MNDHDIHSAVVRWLSSLTALQFIKTEQSGEQPAEPYGAVSLLGTDDIRTWPQEIDYTTVPAPGLHLLSDTTVLTSDSVILSDVVTLNPVKAIVVTEVEWRFSLHIYGGRPTDLMRPIRSAAQLTQVMEPMFPDLVIHQVSQIRNIPEYVKEAWQPRAQMDFILRGLTKDDFFIDTIEQYGFNIERMIE